jgi:hypothetical protein
MSLILLRSDGGMLTLPDRGSLLLGRESGGNLVVHPPRFVWERSELTPEELTQFAFLVSAAGRAMIDVLPQLAGGCVNYWEAGNWALNDDAEPRGRKEARSHRRMHLHLLGRSQHRRTRRGSGASRRGSRRSQRGIHGAHGSNGSLPPSAI